MLDVPTDITALSSLRHKLGLYCAFRRVGYTIVSICARDRYVIPVNGLLFAASRIETLLNYAISVGYVVKINDFS